MQRPTGSDPDNICRVTGPASACLAEGADALVGAPAARVAQRVPVCVFRYEPRAPQRLEKVSLQWSVEPSVCFAESQDLPFVPDSSLRQIA